MSGRPPPRRVVILGGGTAGWMAANLLIKRWGAAGTQVTLIESKAIGIIGVGEGSTPQPKAFFDDLGVAEAEWTPHCNATYKAGIEFVGWSDRSGHERYFQPFPSELDACGEAAFCHATRLRRNGHDVPAHPDPFYLSTRIARDGRAPIAPANFPFDVCYGYHFDAHLIGSRIQEIATSCGVMHVDTMIADVVLSEAGDVSALVTDDGRRFEADLFIDASGFRAAIIEGALRKPHRSFADSLFNDRAVVTPTPLPIEGARAQTTATAASAGWIWHIPLTSRVGNGYVYSSRYIDPDAAAAELRGHCGLSPDAEVRHLSMKCGRVERSWVRNCLAIGLAQGFLEPVEATAFHLVLATVEEFLNSGKPATATGSTAISLGAMTVSATIWFATIAPPGAATPTIGAMLRPTTGCRTASRASSPPGSRARTWRAKWPSRGLAAITRPCRGTSCWPVTVPFQLPTACDRPDPKTLPIDMAQVERFVGGCALNFPSHRDALAGLSKQQAA